MQHNIKSRGMQIVEAREGRELAGLLRELYVDRHLTQEAIAARLGVTRATVARWMVQFDIEARFLGPRVAEATA